MIKICSLEFVNKETFDTDVFSLDGSIVVSLGEKVTPDKLLRLYFKDIYVEKEPIEIIEDKVEEVKIEKIEIEEEKIEETTPISTEKLEFDEARGKRISTYSTDFAKILNLSEKEILEIEKAAYYQYIGITKLTPADLNDKKFKTKLADAGYNLILKEMNLSEKIAEVAKLAYRKYNPIQFTIRKDEPSEIPYYHIVAIASFYDKLLNKNYSNEEALKKMVQLGSNRFNPFILHKFINMMKDKNG